MDAQLKLKALIGQTIIRHEGVSKDSRDITLETKEGNRYLMTHHQDCCEDVRVTYVHGVDQLFGVVEQVNEEITNDPDSRGESETTTTFVIVTDQGSCLIRWVGTSNGYYSEDVSFEETK